MTREQLYEFIVLSQSLNYSKAARQLYVSQATLSRHIIDLESELDTQLFQRNSHVVTLTPAGRLLRRDAAKMLLKHDEALMHLNFRSISTFGSVSILCSRSASSPLLTRFINQFRKKYPQIDISLSALPDSEIAERMREYDVVFSLLRHPTSEADFDCFELMSLEPCAIVPVQYSFRSSYQMELYELKNKTLILPYVDGESIPFAKIERIAKKATNNRVKIMYVKNVDTALMNVDMGMGITILPKHMENFIYRESRIAKIVDPGCEFPVYAYFNLQKNQKSANLFFTELKNQAALLELI